MEESDVPALGEYHRGSLGKLPVLVAPDVLEEYVPVEVLVDPRDVGFVAVGEEFPVDLRAADDEHLSLRLRGVFQQGIHVSEHLRALQLLHSPGKHDVGAVRERLLRQAVPGLSAHDDGGILRGFAEELHVLGDIREKPSVLSDRPVVVCCKYYGHCPVLRVELFQQLSRRCAQYLHALFDLLVRGGGVVQPERV